MNPRGTIEEELLTGIRRRNGHSMKTWKRTVKEEGVKLGKTQNKLKTLFVARKIWKRSLDALFSNRNNRGEMSKTICLSLTKWTKPTVWGRGGYGDVFFYIVHFALQR